MTEPFPPLPVRPTSGEFLPVIVTDTREQAPLEFRRYSIAGQHDRHDRHDTSPNIENPPFPIRPEYHVDHAHHAQADLISEEAEA